MSTQGKLMEMRQVLSTLYHKVKALEKMHATMAEEILKLSQEVQETINQDRKNGHEADVLHTHLIDDEETVQDAVQPQVERSEEANPESAEDRWGWGHHGNSEG